MIAAYEWPCGHYGPAGCARCAQELVDKVAELIAVNESLRNLIADSHRPAAMPAHVLTEETHLSNGVSAWTDDEGRIWLHAINGSNQAVAMDSEVYHKLVAFIAAMEVAPLSPWAPIAAGIKWIFDFSAKATEPQSGG